MKARAKLLLPLTLALTVVLSGTALYVQAEKDGNAGKGKPAHAERHDNRGHEGRSDRKDAIKEMKKEFDQARKENRDERKAERKDAIRDKKETFQDVRHEFKQAVRERQNGDDNGRQISDEFFDNRFIVDEDWTRKVFVRGKLANGNDFVLIRVTPSDEERLSRLFLDYRNEEPDTLWLGRLFHPAFNVGAYIEDDDLSEITLLPLSYNAYYGLPVHEDFRLGIVNDQVLLLDMDRQLVLDALRFDNEGRLVSRELDIENPRLLTFRLADTEEAYLRAYLINHPDLIDNDLTLGDRFRENILLPLGISQIHIGERLPLLANPMYLPDVITAETDLPGTDLDLAIVGDDLVLIDPETRLVLDVVRDIV